MEIPENHFRHILIFYFRKGKNATQAHRKLGGVCGDKCLIERQCQNWFARFRFGNFDVKDEPRPGRPIVEKVEEILCKIEVVRHISSRDITTELNIDHKTVLNHLPNWIPKKARYLGSTCINSKKFNGLNFHS